MKLKYKNNQWYAGEIQMKPKPICHGKGFCCADRRCDALVWEEALELAISQFKPIAPNNQEKVNRYIYDTESALSEENLKN